MITIILLTTMITLHFTIIVVGLTNHTMFLKFIFQSKHVSDEISSIVSCIVIYCTISFYFSLYN